MNRDNERTAHDKVELITDFVEIEKIVDNWSGSM